jgi:iron complex transport system ATP-binding protein
MLLASGRLLPQSGCCRLFGQDVARLGGEQKNLLASVIYQNMEFETEEKVGDLLKQVFQNGKLKGKVKALRSESDLLEEAVEIFELKDSLEKSLTHLSKGEIQRVLLAFSILYGSDSIFMDEPMFAMEDRQKEASLEYLREFVHKTGKTIYIAMHELDLSKKYADQVLLFYPNRDMSLGTPEEVLTDEDLEKAYEIPAALLKKKEDMTRKQLQEEAKLLSGNYGS